ncbi:MAG: polyketide synthase dehydratase domain-containing protein, partial [Vicinamibacterales bacterium]
VWLGPSLQRDRAAWPQLLETLAALWVRGVPVDWSGFDRPYGHRKVALPTYPFQRQRYWIDETNADPPAPQRAEQAPNSSPLLGRLLQSPVLRDRVFELELRADSPAYLDHHRIDGTAVVPMTAYIEMMLSAAAAVGMPGASLEELTLDHAIRLNDGETRTVQVVVGPEEGGGSTAQVFSAAAAPSATSPAVWSRHASARVRRTPDQLRPEAADIAAIAGRCSERITGADYYGRLTAGGLQYGRPFRAIESLSAGAGEALAAIHCPEDVRAALPLHRAHPALVDACLQPLYAVIPPAVGREPSVYVPVSISRVIEFGPLHRTTRSHVMLRSTEDGAHPRATVDVRLIDDEGSTVLEISGLTLQRAPRRLFTHGRRSPWREWLYDVRWERQAVPDRNAPRPDGQWLIFATAEATAEAVARVLQGRGEECAVIAVQPGSISSPRVSRLLAQTPRTRGRIRAVVLGAMDAGAAPASVEVLTALQRVHSGLALDVVQAVIGSETWHDAQLTLVTRGAQPVADGYVVDPVQASLWGFARVVAVEHPELGCRRIDLDPAAPPDVDALVDELLRDDAEDEVGFRGDERYVARLGRAALAGVPGRRTSAEAVRLQVATTGSLDTLGLTPIQRRAPGEGEVEIQVRAAGMNFKDVLYATGVLPARDPLGLECSGTITRVGPAVGDLRVGDDVVAMVPGCFASYITTRAHYVVRKPSRLTFDEAAAAPVAFLTAYYALVHLARLGRGDRVLIHAATGGVGMAALQLAKRAGAEIFATAGSADKRRRLRALGVDHVFDSRSVEFAAEVRRITDGRGVDVVLNSAAGGVAAATWSVLAAGGRFIELTKTAVLDDAARQRLAPEILYAPIDLTETFAAQPTLLQPMLSALMQQIDTGELESLPCSVFPATNAAAAFRHMAQAKHQGKLVCRFSEAGASGIRSDATYLVTGAFGGLGLQVARWLVERGATSLALLARRPPSLPAVEAVESLRSGGA